MKIYQIREMSTEDIQNELNDTLVALENYRFQSATGQLENYKALKNGKRDVARMKTILKERETGINQNIDKSKKEAK